jgi:Carboxypeptidase regulatory-like domain/TonB dependent receptor
MTNARVSGVRPGYRLGRNVMSALYGASFKRMAPVGLRVIAVVALVAVCSALAMAQVPTGSIAGTVRDSQGLPIGDATVTLSNLQTNASFVSKTGSLGGYQFGRIDYGLYKVTVAKDGFKSGAVNAIKLDAATEYSVVPITLEVGSPTQTVVVEAGAESVNTTSAAVTGTVEKKQIEDLPILDRDPLNLLGLQAGVSRNLPNDAVVLTTINGQRTSFSNMTLDGINIQDNFIRDNALDFSPNQPFGSQAQEFTIINQNGDVENGNGASQVSIVTPKGTNQFHGEGFWYYRTNAWAANDWFNDASGVSLPKLLQNQGGGNIGGPILRNKLFIYGYYELLRLRAQGSTNTTVLSPTIISGVSSATPTLPFTYQPVDANGNPSGGPQTVDLLTLENQSRGGAVPVFTPDPAMLQVIARIPKTPNNTRVGDGMNLLGYQLNSQGNDTQDNYGFRVDYDADRHNSFTGTWAWNRQIVDRNDIDLSYDKIPLVTNNDSSKFLSTAWRWSPRNDFTNEVRFGFNLAPGFFKTAQKFGSYILDDNSVNCTGSPAGGCLAFTDPDPNFLPQGRDTRTWSWQDNASWSKGNHTLKFGLQVQRVTIFTTASGQTIPTYTIGFSTSNPYAPLASDFPAPASASISASALANATLILQSAAGILNQVSQQLNATSQTSGYVPLAPQNRNYTESNWSAYLGDSWRIKSRLTLTYGTRYEYFSPINERDGLVLLPVVPAGQTVQQTLLGNATIDFAGGPSKRPLYGRRMAQFAPNIGLAWDPFGNGKTAVRAGFSMNYANDQFFTAADNAAGGNTGLSTTVANVGLFGPTVGNPQGAQNLTAPPFMIPIDFQTNAINATNSGAGLGSLAGYAIDPKLKTPYVQQWNLSIQRDLGWNTSLTVGYVANHGVGLFRAIDVNQLVLKQNGFLADFNRARSNGFLAMAANPAGGFVPDYNPSIPGSQPLTVFPNLAVGGLIDNPTVSNLIFQGQIGTLVGLYHALEFDTGNNPEPGFNNPVTLFPNPFIMGGDLLKNSSFSTYNAGIVELRRRFSRGLYFQGNYVYSKVMTDFGGTQSQFQPYQDNARPKLEKERAPFDLTHAFKGNFTYELPIGKGHRLLSSDSRVLGLLTNGWQTASIFTWQTGAPFSILSEWGSFNRGLRTTNNTAVATLTHQQLSARIGTFEQTNGRVFLIDPALVSPDGTGAPASPQLSCAPAVPGGFCNPQPGQVGNLQLNAFNSPTYFDWDASAGKDFSLTERLKLTFRAEAFNILNHPVFSANAVDPINQNNVNEELINSNTFGQSTSTVSKPRRLQLSLLIRF